jgi:hypothetical protein
LFGLLFDPEDRDNVTTKHPLTFIELHGVIFQKTELFITTVANTQILRVIMSILWAACLENPDSIPGRSRDFSLHRCVQIGSGAHPTSYPVNTKGSVSRIKLLGSATDHSPLNSALENAEIKNAWSYISTPSNVPN